MLRSPEEVRDSGKTTSFTGKIDDLFDVASELPPEECAAFLDANCGSDPSVRAEIERLLVHHARAGILDSSLVAGVASRPDSPNPSRNEPMLSDGALLSGRFRIVRLIGSGGMGEVYEAQDLTSGLNVAVKTIRAEVAADTRLTRRFRKELLLARDISHPNVCRVYEYWETEGEAGGRFTFFTMELLKGETLAHRIASRGRLKGREALAILRQVAAGLAEVHRLGIVHRDLKPANILLVRDPAGAERAVVTDFGLALVTRDDGVTQTQTGLVMGTPHYMAPELFTGGEVTAAADVYSFGVTALEMVTGENHPLMAPRSGAPELDPVWDKLLLQCFDREPARRPESALAVTAMLARGSRRWQRALIAACILMGTAVLAAAAWNRIDPAPARAPANTQLTFDSGFTTGPSVSADGKLMVYSSDRGSKGDLNIWLQRLDTGETRQLTDDPGDEDNAAISPDGKLIAYVSEKDTKLYVKAVSGGAPRAIARWAGDPRFSPDGTLIAYWTGGGEVTTPSGAIWLAPVSGGSPRRLVTAFADARFPTWSPDGKSILFQGARSAYPSIVNNTELWITDTADRSIHATGAAVRLKAAGLALHETPMSWDGSKVIFAAQAGHSTNLWTLSLYSILNKALGGPHPLTNGAGLQQVPAVLPDGRVAYSSWREQSHLWRVDVERGIRKQLTFEDSMDTRVSVSPDGNTLVFGRRLGADRNIWTMDLRTGAQRELAANELAIPYVSPSGRTAAFSTGSSVRLLEIASGRQSTLCESCGELLGWTPDESGILYREPSGNPVQTIQIFDIASKQRRKLLSGVNLREVSISPDGTAVAFSARKSGLYSRIFVARLNRDGSAGPWSPVTSDDEWSDKPVWSDDGRTVYFHSTRDGSGCLWSRRVSPDALETEKPVPVSHFHTATLTLSHLPDTAIGIAQAKGNIYISVGADESNIWAVKP